METTGRLPDAGANASGRAYEIGTEQEPPAGGLSAVLLHVLETLQRHKWAIVGAGVSGALIGLVIALFTAPQYLASARLEIGFEKAEVLPSGPQQSTSTSLIYDQTAVGLLSSRSLAERVVRDLNLAAKPAIVDQTLPRDTRHDVATAVVQGGTSVQVLVQSRLLDVSYSFGEPILAAQIANALAVNFIQATLDRQSEQSRYMRSYLENQLRTTRDRLEQSERERLAFERARDIVAIEDVTENGSPTSQSINNLQIKAIAGAYADAQKKRIVAEEEFRNLSRAPVEEKETSGIQVELAQLRSREAELAKTFLPDYPELAAARARIASLESGLGSTESRVSAKVSGGLRARYQSALAEERQFARELENLKSAILDERVDSARYTILQREVDTNRELYNALLEQYKKVGATGAIGETNVSIVDRASPPESPYWPIIPLNLIAGLVIGALLGFIGVFLYDLLHEKIVRPRDIEGRLGIKSLGAIPKIDSDASFAELLADPKSPVTEAYLNVANLLRLSTKFGVPRTLLVTSTIPEEGKSSSSYGLALAIAKSGRRVLLVDSDLRRPTFRVEGHPNDRGLANLLTGAISVDEAIVEGDGGISYILTGGTPPNPSELFSGETVDQIIEELVKRFDVVVFDAPPILSLVDAPALAARCDATLLVVQSDRVRVAHVQQSVAALRRAGAYIIGALLTKYDYDADGEAYDYGYGAGYHYSYGKDGQEAAAQPARQLVIARAPGTAQDIR